MPEVTGYDIADSGCRALLPKVRVGVVRDQAESLLTPANDIVPYLEHQQQEHPGRWDVTGYDERDFGGLLGANDFDVIVLGYNATLFTKGLREELERMPPSTPVLLLHQRDQECFAFLRDELAVEVVKLGEGVEEARPRRERVDEFEPVLNWPHADVVKDRRFPAKAISGLSFSPDGAWRVVLEVFHGAQRVPALVRTRSNRRQRIVACSLLLRPAEKDEHAHLLENLLIYCAFGWPDVGILELDDGAGTARARSLAAGMALWTERRVEVTAPSAAAVPIGAWPLKGVRRLVAPETVDPDAFMRREDAQSWLRRGGELVRVADDGAVTVHARPSDRFLVLREWAMWFTSLDEGEWLGRLSPARAVLGLLADVLGDERNEEDLKALAELQLDPAKDYADAVRDLLAARVRHHNVDETISATAAALDVDRLVRYGGLGSYERVRVKHWLRQAGKHAGPADRLDVLRCLRDRDGVKDWLAQEAQATRIDGLVATRLRQAIRACWPRGEVPRDLVPAPVLEALDGETVTADLAGRPLLCAEFIAALHHPKSANGVFEVARFKRSHSVAVEHLSAFGFERRTRDVRARCTRTLALLRHVENQELGMALVPGRADLPATAAETVLREATEARRNERQARQDLPHLGNAVQLLGSFALAFAIVGLIKYWNLFGVRLTLDPWWVVFPVVVGPAAVLALLRLFLARSRKIRRERRELRLGQSAAAFVAVAAALASATAAWPLATEDGQASVAGIVLALLVFATTFAALTWVLLQIGLAPPWAPLIPRYLAELKGPLAWFTQRAERPAGAETNPPAAPAAER